VTLVTKKDGGLPVPKKLKGHKLFKKGQILKLKKPTKGQKFERKFVKIIEIFLILY